MRKPNDDQTPTLEMEMPVTPPQNFSNIPTDRTESTELWKAVEIDLTNRAEEKQSFADRLASLRPARDALPSPEPDPLVLTADLPRPRHKSRISPAVLFAGLIVAVMLGSVVWLQFDQIKLRWEHSMQTLMAPANR